VMNLRRLMPSPTISWLQFELVGFSSTFVRTV